MTGQVEMELQFNIFNNIKSALLIFLAMYKLYRYEYCGNRSQIGSNNRNK